MRTFKRLLLLLLVLAVIAGVSTYERPLWVADQVQHLEMWHHGAHRRFVQLPEGRIRYIEQPAKTNGGGAPLLLIHGLAGRSDDFGPLIPKFVAQGFHVYALDLLGYGESDKPASSDYSISAEERVVTEFMDAVHLQHADVVGWSMGGWIALKLALDNPQHVDRLVVYDSAGIVFQTDLDISLFAPTDGAGVTRLIRRMSPTLPVPPPFMRRDIIRNLARQRWIVERSLIAMRTGKDIVDFRLAEMQPPLLIVFGAQDVLIPPSVGETMHKLDPRSVYASVEGCGHFAPIECSATLAKVSGEFFKAQPPIVGGELKLTR